MNLSVPRFKELLKDSLRFNIDEYKKSINEHIPMLEAVNSSDIETEKFDSADLKSKIKLPNYSFDRMLETGFILSMAECVTKAYFENVLRKFFALVESRRGVFPPLKERCPKKTLHSIMDRSSFGESLTIIHPKTMAHIIESALVTVTRVFSFDGYAVAYDLTNIPYDDILYVRTLVCEGSDEGLLFTLDGDETEMCFDDFDLDVKQHIGMENLYRYLEVSMSPYINFQSRLFVHQLP